jgi:hypothetical protein
VLGEAREFRDPDCNFVTGFVIFLLKQKSIYLNACNEEDIGFVTAVEFLLKMKLFPVETVHVCMALASCGITTSPYLSMIISEFVKLLPKDEISLAIDYLAFTGDRRILVDFLLSQDIRRTTVNLSVPGKEGAEDLIREECDENRLSINTLQVLLVCGYYENAVSVFFDISENVSSLSPSASVSGVRLCSVLLTKASIDDRAGVQNAGLWISLYALSLACELPQSERAELIESTEELIMSIEDPGLVNESWYETTKAMIQVCQILVFLDSCMFEDAMRVSKHEPHLIPVHDDQIENSVDIMNAKILPSTKCVETTIIKMLAFLQRDYARYERQISSIIEFTRYVEWTEEGTGQFAEIAEDLERQHEKRKWRQ